MPSQVLSRAQRRRVRISAMGGRARALSLSRRRRKLIARWGMLKRWTPQLVDGVDFATWAKNASR
jgi:hypothetical protein